VSDPLWYKDAVFYELHVRAFQDGNGDGIGDFPGLTGRLDYLKEMGVDCLWLLPFFPSPLRDDGYDVSDYRSIHPDYGTMADFERFLGSGCVSYTKETTERQVPVSTPVVAAAPVPADRVVTYPEGRYQLYGDGTRVPYYWVWVPSGATVTPAPPVPPPVPTR
jgi:hypothetical protein